jgi:hypothetical protein
MARAEAHDALGEEEATRAVLRRMQDRVDAGTSDSQGGYLGWTLISIGEIDRGISLIERAFERQNFGVVFTPERFRRTPAVWDHPRFQELVRAMRLDDASLERQGFPVTKGSS